MQSRAAFQLLALCWCALVCLADLAEYQSCAADTTRSAAPKSLFAVPADAVARYPHLTRQTVSVFHGDERDEERAARSQSRMRGSGPRIMAGESLASWKVIQVLAERGYDERASVRDAASLRWVRVGLPDVPTSDFPLDGYARLSGSQAINRLPRMSTELNQKDAFALHVRRAGERHGQAEFDFHPRTFVLPRDRAALETVAAHAPSPTTPFIVKPVFGGRGVGIHVESAASVVANTPMDGEWIVQEYIPNPMIIDGRKFTLRLYVLVTSVDPLIVYWHTEGIAKFAGTPYGNAESDERFFNQADGLHMHITNNAANSDASAHSVSDDPNVDSVGLRRSVRAVRTYLQERGLDSDAIFSRIKDALLKSIILVERNVSDAATQFMPQRPRPKAFQLLGVDVDLDDTQKPFVIESNVNPSLSVHAPFELGAKERLLGETFDLVQLTRFNASAYIEAEVKPRLRRERTCGMPGAPENACVPDAPDSWQLDLAAQFEFQQAVRSGYELLYPRAASWQHYRRFFETAHASDAFLGAWVTAFHAEAGDDARCPLPSP